MLITHSATSHGPLAISLLISASLNGEDLKRIKGRGDKWDISSFSGMLSMPWTEMLVQGFQAGTRDGVSIVFSLERYRMLF